MGPVVNFTMGRKKSLDMPVPAKKLLKAVIFNYFLYIKAL